MRDAKKIENTYKIDQDNYIKRFIFDKPKEDGKTFWLLRNMDYLQWSEPPEEIEDNSRITTLVVCTPERDLEPLLFRIFQRIKHEGDRLIYFFYGSSQFKSSSNPKLFVIFNLVNQLAQYYPPEEGSSLRKILIRGILSLYRKKDLAEALEDSDDALETLTRIRTQHDVIWTPFVHVLKECRNLDKKLEPGKWQSERRKLRLVLYPNEDLEVIKDLLEGVRGIITGLQLDYDIRVIIAYNSTTSSYATNNLDLKSPTESLIEHDRERKG